MNLRQLFFRHLAQTSPAPIALEIIKAEGSLLYDSQGKAYIDLIGGISVANVGHRHPAVTEAIKKQVDQYLHVMVYGEIVQSPQVLYAKLLTDYLPSSLNSVYFTNSGAEAVEAAMKLSKKVTARSGIIAFKNSYHGSTQGALSIIGSEYWRNAYRPLLPDIEHLNYNCFEDLKYITNRTACVVAETVQAEAGIIIPAKQWVQALEKKCRDTGALLILDEIQTGFGRTGTTWSFEQFEILPDMLLLGKALGGGMPLGALVADKKLMDFFSDNPVLGHITTFGGHPVCCAAGMAAFQALKEENMEEGIEERISIFITQLVHSKIKNIRNFGLWMAVEFDSFQTCKKVIDGCIKKGVLTDWFLFAPNCLRIAPPINISLRQIKEACRILVKEIEEA
ncbi:MAG: aspartate aminotransferase family protein [Flavisolibacter sp.]